MSKQLDRIKTAYSGWHNFSDETPKDAPAQTDLISEIERLKAELAEAKAAPKKGKTKLEVVE